MKSVLRYIIGAIIGFLICWNMFTEIKFNQEIRIINNKYFKDGFATDNIGHMVWYFRPKIEVIKESIGVEE